MNKSFSIIDHTADIGLSVTGKTLEDLFTASAEGMFSLITDTQTVEENQSLTIEVTADSYEDLLHHWLRELLYEFSAHYYLFSRFTVRIEQTSTGVKKLIGICTGETIQSGKHPINMEIKTVTYHQLSVKETPNGWEGRFIFDI